MKADGEIEDLDKRHTLSSFNDYWLSFPDGPNIPGFLRREVLPVPPDLEPSDGPDAPGLLSPRPGS